MRRLITFGLVVWGFLYVQSEIPHWKLNSVIAENTEENGILVYPGVVIRPDENADKYLVLYGNQLAVIEPSDNSSEKHKNAWNLIQQHVKNQFLYEQKQQTEEYSE